MKATILIENTTSSNLLAEWGLSIYIEYNDKKYLIDAGGSDKFANNASALDINLAEIDAAMLSHAHYDHSLGMDKFCELNTKAKFLLRKGAAEDCYGKILCFKRYIGLGVGTLDRLKDRIDFIEGKYMVEEGVYVLPHDKPNLEKIGKQSHQYIKVGKKYLPDDYKHEQSIVFDTEKGLVIISPCSHGGAGNIINEVKRSFPDRKIYAIIGGFHLVTQPKPYIINLAEQIKDTGICEVYTGHCTGERALGLLTEVHGDKVKKLETGLKLEFI